MGYNTYLTENNQLRCVQVGSLVAMLDWKNGIIKYTAFYQTVGAAKPRTSFMPNGATIKSYLDEYGGAWVSAGLEWTIFESEADTPKLADQIYQELISFEGDILPALQKRFGNLKPALPDEIKEMLGI